MGTPPIAVREREVGTSTAAKTLMGPAWTPWDADYNGDWSEYVKLAHSTLDISKKKLEQSTTRMETILKTYEDRKAHFGAFADQDDFSLPEKDTELTDMNTYVRSAKLAKWQVKAYDVFWQAQAVDTPNKVAAVRDLIIELQQDKETDVRARGMQKHVVRAISRGSHTQTSFSLSLS